MEQLGYYWYAFVYVMHVCLTSGIELTVRLLPPSVGRHAGRMSPWVHVIIVCSRGILAMPPSLKFISMII